jgi:hypothetical protein
VKPKPLAPPPAPEPEPEPMPEIFFSLRGTRNGRIANDRPLFVGVRIELSGDSAKTIALAPASGAWSNAVKIGLSAVGAPDKVLLQAERAGDAADAPTATLGSGSAAEGTWWFASADLAKLPPGDYRVQVKLAIPDGAGWHGSVAGEPANFALVAAEAATTPEQQTQRALARAEEAMLAQDWPKAAQLLDERLAMEPDNIELLQSRAVVCLEAGNVTAANACVNRAWARVTREKWMHPPADLYVLTQTVAAAFTQAPVHVKSPLPQWSVPPDAVLAPLPDAKPPAPAK